MKDLMVKDYCSFLIRFWYEPHAESWQAEIEHVQSHRRESINNLPEINDFLKTYSGSIISSLTPERTTSD